MPTLVLAPAVPRNSVMSLPHLPPVDISEQVFAPDFVGEDANDDGHSSTDGEDELGRAVMSAMRDAQTRILGNSAGWRQSGMKRAG